ncbi:BspA family leucine-rich repeat surface protein, partial [Enterococcus entomosocium]
MKKKFWTFLSVVLLVSPSLIETGQVFADTAETEGVQEQENQVPNKADPSNRFENTFETSSNRESNENIEVDSIDQTAISEASNDTMSSSESSTSNTESATDSSLTDAAEEDSVLQEENATEPSSLLAETVASGTFGTSEWTIDAEGTLHIGAGEFGYNPNDNEFLSPWNAYANEIKQITFEGSVIAYNNSSSLFARLGNITKINHLELLDTSNVTDMSRMFYNLQKLTSIDVSSFDTSNVKRMNSMFGELSALTNLDISNFNTSNVTNMSSMFYNLKKVASLDLSNLDTSNVTNMHSMFTYLGVTSLDLSTFNTSNVTDMGNMFACLTVENLDVSHLDTSKVRNMSGMFLGIETSSLDLSTFNTSNVTNMSSMFQYGSSFNTKGLKEINLSSFDTSKVTNMSYMFLNAGGLTGLDLSSFNTSNVANMRGMFDFTTRDFKKLKLGSNFKFLSDAALNDISFSPTVKWQNVGTGTNEQPNGNFIMSSSELMSDYDGSTMADTYVWQPAIQTAVKVHDSTLYIGTEWKAEDNFDSAIDKDGNPVDFADVTVEGTVDTSKTG